MKRTRMEILKLAKEYLEDKDYHKSWITYEWMDKISDALGLKELNDEQLGDMWDMVYLTLENECYYYRLNGKVEEDMKWMDVKSAFVEVVNREARERRGER